MLRKRIEKIEKSNKRFEETIIRFQEERRKGIRNLAAQYEEQNQRVINRLSKRAIQSR